MARMGPGIMALTRRLGTLRLTVIPTTTIRLGLAASRKAIHTHTELVAHIWGKGDPAGDAPPASRVSVALWRRTMAPCSKP
jgi:hypothetical protein